MSKKSKNVKKDALLYATRCLFLSKREEADYVLWKQPFQIIQKINNISFKEQGIFHQSLPSGLIKPLAYVY